MHHIPCQTGRAGCLKKQELRRARAIARSIFDHSPRSVTIAARSILRLSPHSYERACAAALLASTNRRAA